MAHNKNLISEDFISRDFISHCKSVLGSTQVIEEESELAPWLTDERGIFTGKAICLLYPQTVEQIQAVVTAAAKDGIAIVPIGANTGLCGAATPFAEDEGESEDKDKGEGKDEDEGGSHTMPSALCSLKKMNHILSLDEVNETITVQAGATILETAEAASKSGLYFPLRFGATASAQIGGSIATNAGGYSTIKYGNMRDLLLGVKAVMADGTVIDQLNGLRKDNRGYNLAGLLCGSEGTLGIITEAVLKLFPAPADIQTALVPVKNPSDAVKILGIFKQKNPHRISAFEWMNSTSLQTGSKIDGVENPLSNSAPQKEPQAILPQAILIELDSNSKEDSKSMADSLNAAIEKGWAEDALIAKSKTSAQAFWNLRESIPQGEKLAGGSAKHDISVPISAVAEFIKKADGIFDAQKIPVCAYGHLGDGNIHYNLLTAGLSASKIDECTQQIFDIVQNLGGSFSAEHGIGRLRLQELQKRGDAGSVSIMKKIKSAVDPKGILNPGKVIQQDLPEL